MGDIANLSREFRALVAAIRGPLDEELAERGPVPTARRERLRNLQRDFRRLLQLVNTLFDARDLDQIESARRAESGAVGATTTVIPMLRDGGAPPPPESRGDDSNKRSRRSSECDQRDMEAMNYSLSHELRGPLRAVNGFAQVLLSDHAQLLDRDGQELLAQLQSSVARMSTLTDDLLVLFQVGRAALHRRPIDVGALARRAIADLRLREPSRSVEVGIATGLTATGDERLVRIALENLLGNAWKFTGQRACSQIIVEREDRGVFAIRDNGAGFQMDRAERMFEPFQRLHAHSEFGGTGLGLAIVRRVVERHGGQVWAHGEVDRGATIRFTLDPIAS